ncbi:hypothetical protein [Paenibacillus radicis (ex Xue et al. 2023)]|uniref:Uncharacterized protein n=1 Tax=Paenibacillus radicis (ex Xue et al. 2023) TaxID=2972489 RepID=A0ABT1YVF4_9BACL|nr:hypothetical protein [Paenibacillus radicis (ex Xue et al. 2023)]MCR8636939.1 hypothetical protein [Paenibacillus radicis (ex Xue et al. 2023)]
MSPSPTTASQAPSASMSPSPVSASQAPSSPVSPSPATASQASPAPASPPAQDAQQPSSASAEKDSPLLDLKVKSPSISLDTPLVKIEVPSLEVKVSTDRATPASIELPAIKVDEPAVQVKTPEAAAELPLTELGQASQIKLETPSVHVNTPLIDVQVQSAPVSIQPEGAMIPATEGKTSKSGLLPNLELKTPAISLDAPLVKVDVPSVEVSISSNLIPQATVSLPVIKVDTPIVKVQTPAVEAEVPLSPIGVLPIQVEPPAVMIPPIQVEVPPAVVIQVPNTPDSIIVNSTEIPLNNGGNRNGGKRADSWKEAGGTGDLFTFIKRGPGLGAGPPSTLHENVPITDIKVEPDRATHATQATHSDSPEAGREGMLAPIPELEIPLISPGVRFSDREFLQASRDESNAAEPTPVRKAFTNRWFALPFTFIKRNGPTGSGALIGAGSGELAGSPVFLFPVNMLQYPPKIMNQDYGGSQFWGINQWSRPPPGEPPRYMLLLNA